MLQLEGDKAEGALILEFPDMASAKVGYWSPAYREAVASRHAGSASRALFVQGA